MAFCTECGEQISGEALACPKCGKPQHQNTIVEGGKNRMTAALLAFFVGWLGVHWFYLGRAGKGVLYLFTLGLLGIGVLIDFINFLTMSDKNFNSLYN